MRAARELLSPRIKKQVLDLGIYGRSDYTRFLILGRSRVGSNLLRGLLNAHPQVATFGEIFRDRTSIDWDHMGYFVSKRVRSLLQHDPVKFLDLKVLGRYPSFIRAVGFKLFYYHAKTDNAASVWPYLEGRHDLKIVHLKRRNVLHTHLSRKRAALTNRWVNTSGQSEAMEPIRLDYDECVNDFMQTRAWEEEYDRYFADHPLLEVQDERLSADYRSEMRRIERFLDVSPRPLDPSTFRQTGQRLSAAIANYAELRERFTGTMWEEFFSE